MSSVNDVDNLMVGSTEEDLQFYKKIIENMPAFMGIQQIDDLGDPNTNHNIWASTRILDFLGYCRDEIDALGAEYFIRTMHPDDMEMITNALNKLKNGEDATFGGVYRLKPKNQDYKWVIGTINVFEKRNGMPWRFLNVSLDIDQMKDTQEQIIVLTKENLQLKNKIKTSTLTRREKQVIRLIVAGHTDKEIGKALFISPATAKTHRNNILRKLHLKNAASIVHFASENGLD